MEYLDSLGRLQASHLDLALADHELLHFAGDGHRKGIDEPDDLGNLEYHLGGVTLLDRIPIKPTADVQILGVGQVFCQYDLRADGLSVVALESYRDSNRWARAREAIRIDDMNRVADAVYRRTK